MKKQFSNIVLTLFFAFTFSLLFAVVFNLPVWIGFTGLLAVSLLRSPAGALFETIVKPLEIDDLKVQLKALKTELETAVTQKAKEDIVEVQKQIKSLEDKYGKIDTEGAIASALNEIRESLKSVTEWKVTKDEADNKNQEALDKLLLDKNRKAIPEGKETKSFNDLLGEAIEKNAESIKNHRKGSPELKIDLMPEVKITGTSERLVKAVGDMSITANFANATTLYQDVRPLIQSPYNRVWLSDVLPGGQSTGTQLVYPKENGGEGAAALWEDPSQDKPQIDLDLTSATVPFKWIAGIVIVDRGMLDDIAFLTSYIQNKMLISLKTAENAFILNGASVAPTVDGLLDVATAYSGVYTRAIDRIVDALYGQIVEDTFEFYQGNILIIRPRDAVALGLNTASGSGEYDLPNGVTAFVNNNPIALQGIDIVRTTSLSANTFVALDKSATMFIRRMVPELRTFEDATLAKKNKIMFRIEERATLAIFNNSAIVTGDFDTSVS